MQSKKRILVVDDVAINLSVAEHTLGSKYDVITVNSGARAIRYLRTEKPDLILLDIRMQHKDGIETLQEIRALENGAKIPVIMLTSKNDKESVLDCAKLGIYDYVLKPFVPKDLLSRIQSALDHAERLSSESEPYIKEDEE